MEQTLESLRQGRHASDVLSLHLSSERVLIQPVSSSRSKWEENSSGMWYDIRPFLPSSASVATVLMTFEPISRLSLTDTRYSASSKTGGLSFMSRTSRLRVR